MKAITTALLLLLPVLARAQGCDGWMQPDFWVEAGARDIATCTAQGYRADSRVDGGATPFHLAAAAGNLDALGALLALDPQGLANRDEQGYTPLHYAAENSPDVAFIRAVAGLGADVGAFSDYGVSVIDLAAGYSTPQVITALIELGADPAPLFEPSSHALETPIMFAARYNPDPAVLALLADHGANLRDTDMRLNSLLHIAVMSENRPRVIRALVAMGLDVDTRQFDGLTPLHMALGDNAQLALVRALLDAGADPDRRDNLGVTPLALGAANGVDPAIIDLLVAYGGDVNVMDEWGQTPLHGAASHKGNLPVVAALVAQGGDINARDYDLFTPLHFAAATGDAGLVEGMIALGADPGAFNRGKRYPASFATVNGVLQGTRALEMLQAAATSDPQEPAVCAGWVTREFWRAATVQTLRACLPFVDLEARGPFSQTPLMMAMMARADDAVMRALIGAGANVNETDIAGSTPLHFAASGNDLALARLLIARGADLDAQDNDGQTPLHRATKTDAGSDMARLLLAAGADPGVIDHQGRLASETEVIFDPENTGN